MQVCKVLAKRSNAYPASNATGKASTCSGRDSASTIRLSTSGTDTTASFARIRKAIAAAMRQRNAETTRHKSRMTFCMEGVLRDGSCMVIVIVVACNTYTARCKICCVRRTLTR